MTDIVKVLRGEELFPCKANAVEEIRCGRGDCTCDMLKMEKAADEIERLREALREMLSVAEVDQLENLSICDIGSERSKMKSRAVASRCGMLLGKLRKIARAALGEGKE
jgi:hypothetical protein